MTKAEIDQLILPGNGTSKKAPPELIETHISWVFIDDRFAYKIKKPIKYSFLDFSTLERRKYFCEREIELNQRLTEGIYLDVVPVKISAGNFVIGNEKGGLIDYAVRMKKQDRNRQMDVLLRNGTVTGAQLVQLANKMAHFHQHATIVYEKDPHDIPSKFKDLEGETHFLQDNLGDKAGDMIRSALLLSEQFSGSHAALLAARVTGGFCRDGHGDLHSRNIFLLETPQPFDCIEFSDDLRQVDVLNEIAFLCMDLDSFGRPDLMNIFTEAYTEIFPVLHSKEMERLFLYYKSYRANIRAKVNSLRARSAQERHEKDRALAECRSYLELMTGYLARL
jgi:aminoglycoside phosphotransferase family enzyme